MSTDGAWGALPVRDFLQMGISLVGVLVVGRRDPLYRVMFRLRLLNGSDVGICLMGRKWMLKDAAGNTRIIEGEKVFNDTPILKPGSVYSYSGYHEFSRRPVSMDVRFFGVDQSRAPFVSPPLVFPRQCFAQGKISR